MKYLKKFFESSSPIEEIGDNFQFINDEFGKPSISESKYGDSTKYFFRWDLKFDISKFQNINSISKNIELISELMKDIKSASSILDDYDFNVSVSDELKIEIVPKEYGINTFEFIKGYKYRSLNINKNEIQRFFRSKGINVIDWEETYNEYSGSGDVNLTLDKESLEVTREFKLLFDRELQEKDKEIDREYYCEVDSDSVNISTNEEKAVVSLV